jgi:eukaryotic-like serine/threonine-protein kinase
VKREAERFNLAMDAIKLFHGEVSEDLLLKEKQFEKLRAKLLRGATDFYGKLDRLLAGQSDSSPRSALGRAYAELGKLTGKWGLASALDGQAGLSSDPVKALATYRRELVIREQLALAHPDVSGYQNALATTHNNIAGRLEELGRLNESVESARRSVEIWQSAADAFPAVISVQSNVSYGLYSLGEALTNLGRSEEAIAAYLRAKVILQRVVAADPTQSGHKRGLATTLGRIGSQLQQTGHPDLALAEFEQELLIRNELANRGTSRAQNSLATCHVNKASAQLALGRPGEARTSCDRATSIREDLVKANPENPEFRIGLAESLLRSGQVRRSTGDTVGAATDWRRAIVLYEELSRRSGETAVFEACPHAMLSGVAGLAGSGMTASDGAIEAQRALDILRTVIVTGYRGPGLRTEPALDPLRGRPDYQALMMDLVFPTEPFAQ